MKKQHENWYRYLIPKEHGAWAMWVLPFIIGVVAAGQWVIESLLIFGACLFIFAARTALASAIRLRRRSGALALKCAASGILELLIASAMTVPILLQLKLLMAIIALVAVVLLIADLWWIKEHSEHTLFAELLGVAGFSLTAPTAYVVSTGNWNFEATLLWVLSFGFFVGSIFYVKLRVVRMSANKRKNSKIEQFYARLALVYVATITGMALLFSTLTWVPVWLVLAFLPWVLHILWDVFRWQPQKDIYRVGWTLVAHAVYFTLFVSLIFALN
jgi:hypothetical protein